MSDDWDVDSYKSEFENEDHWQLRRNFMLAHKDKFPEDELVCLAQVFTNIEFMGCRYPDKTMIRVAELAKGVVEKFREQRRNSLKRTFVAASDAASTKVKGHLLKKESPVSLRKLKKMDESEINSKEIEKTTITDEKQSRPETPSLRVSKYGGVKTFNIKSDEQLETYFHNKSCEKTYTVSKTDEDVPIVKSNGPLGNFVLILGCTDEHPFSIIQRSSSLNKCKMRWEFEKGSGITFVCKLYINNQCIATGTGPGRKISKIHTAMVAVAKLRESYYGIRIKSKFFSDTTISPAQLGSNSKNPPEQLGEDNVGRKLMKLMGWQGGGLGSKGQGIEEPISDALHVKRDGLGFTKNTSSLGEFKSRAKTYIQTWMKAKSDQDLVFSSDFSLDERKILHEIATSFKLKSRSYGKEPGRQVVIFRKYDPWEILKELLRAGGTSDKYELLYPTNT